MVSCSSTFANGRGAVEHPPPSLAELLERSAALHRHLCPRQVLGVQMGRWAAQLLELDLPQVDKRLLTFVETDGCFADGVAVATNCWVGRRTMRVVDYGKVAATFVDTCTGQALRLSPNSEARDLARGLVPDARSRWEAMLHGYQRLPLEAMFDARPVALRVPISAIVGQAGWRVTCGGCGEEILNHREVVVGQASFCLACATEAYYDVPVDDDVPVDPVDIVPLHGAPATQSAAAHIEHELRWLHCHRATEEKHA